MVKVVKDIPFFKDRQLDDSAIIEIVNAMTLRSVPADKYVMEYGDAGDHFYLLLCGHVNISIPDPSRIESFKQLQRDIVATEKELKDCQVDVDQLNALKGKLEMQKIAEDSILSKLPGFMESAVTQYLD